MEKKKLKVVLDYTKLPRELKEQVKLLYAKGVGDYLVNFTTSKGQKVTALRFETDEKIYLLRLSEDMAMILSEDEHSRENYFFSEGACLADDEIQEEVDHFLDYMNLGPSKGPPN